jgi:phosphoglycolate phosphatase
MKYKYVLWDFDGTLCDTTNAILESLRHTVEFCNKEKLWESPKIFEDTLLCSLVANNKGIRDIFEQLFVLAGKHSAQENQITACIGEYRRYYAHRGEQLETLFPEAKELLAEIQKSGIRQSLVSNKYNSFLIKALEKFNIHHFFEIVIGDTAEIENPLRLKPYPDSFHHIIKPYFSTDNRELHSAEFIMIGDAVTDVMYAQNACITSCWASYGFSLENEVLNLNPDFIAHSIKDYRNILFE